MAQNITLLGASYSDVPAVELPKTGGGTASFTDVTDTTALASDVLQGKYFFNASGVLTLGTNQGGSGDGYVWQDSQGYVHLSDEEGTQPIYDTLNVSSSGTFTPATGHAYNSVVVPSGTAGYPTATKGTVSNHSVDVTPSVTNTTGYITGSTKTGTGVTVSASELVSGTYNVTSSGTKDVTNYASVSVPSGTAGTPTASKGAVSNHSIAVTPSVTNTTGYITGSTKTGTAVNVSASELVSGTKSITENGTGIDVTNYASVNVSVPSEPPSLQTKTKTYTPSTSQQTESVTADSGYDGLEEVDITVNAMPSGSVTAPSTISGTSASVSTGTNTLTLSKTVSVTPNVTTAGYISSGTAGNSSVSLTASVTTKGATTYTPSTSAQTIASGTYLTGTQTISAMPSGTAGTPTASKGTVSNHAVTVTPSVTNTTGYITGGTKTGTGVSVSASELVSGNKSITANGNNIDVADYSTVSVNVPTGGGASNLVQGTFTTSATEGTTQTVNIPYTGNGYPISLSVFPSEGTYKNGGTAYNTIKQYAVWYFNASKCYPDTAPDYTGSGSGNSAMTLVRYKSSTGVSTSMSNSAVNNSMVYAQTPTTSAVQVIKISSATTLSVLTASTTYGLLPSTEYTYVMSYSS